MTPQRPKAWNRASFQLPHSSMWPQLCWVSNKIFLHTLKSISIFLLWQGWPAMLSIIEHSWPEEKTQSSPQTQQEMKKSWRGQDNGKEKAKTMIFKTSELQRQVLYKEIFSLLFLSTLNIDLQYSLKSWLLKSERMTTGRKEKENKEQGRKREKKKVYS